VAVTAPKTRDGQVEMIRVLRVARRGALKARVAAAEQLYEVLYSAPEELRQPLLGLKTNRAWLRQHGTTTRIARRGIESSTRPRRKSSGNTWTVDLQDTDGTRYSVAVGSIGGSPSTSRITEIRASV
jgi:hypothetical protein